MSAENQYNNNLNTNNQNINPRDIETIKFDLQRYYELEADYRNAAEKRPWKEPLRAAFGKRLQAECKRTLLELGPGTGQDSRFFMDNGLSVTAVDLSGEMVRF